MKISIKAEALKSALDLLVNIVERKTTIPVLATIRFDANDGKLSLTGTDLDNYLSVEMEAEITRPGTSCLPARRLREVCDAVAGGTINIECDGSTARLSQGALSYKTYTTSADAFPEIPAFGATPITAGSEKIRALIAHTLFSITQEEGRYTLSGAKVLIDKTGTVFITTDGHRLSLAQVEEITSSEEIDVLIPRRALNVMADLSQLSDAIHIGVDGERQRVYVRAGTVLLNSRLLSGQFPKWEQVLPKTFARSVEVDSEECATALGQVMIAADRRTHYLQIGIDDGTAKISASDSEESASTSIPITGNGNESMSLSFNGRYLREVMSLRKGRVAIDINKPDSQVGIRLLGDSILDDYQHVLMPCR